MSISRRRLIGATLGGGAIAAVSLPVAWAAGSDRPVAPPQYPPRLLLGDGAPDAFVEGARLALAATGLGVTGSQVVHHGEVDTLADSIAWLQAGCGRRLIGLMDDAEATLMQQMARDGRLRWLSLAHHSQGTGNDFHSRHVVTALPSNGGLAHALAVDLAAAGRDFLVTDRPVGASTAAPASISGKPGAGEWEMTLGETLGLIAAGRWPQQATRAQSFAGRGRREDDRHFALTSFVIAS